MRSRYLLLSLLMLVTFFSATAQDAAPLIGKLRDKLEKLNDYAAWGILRTNVVFLQVPPTDIRVYYRKPDQFKVKRANGISVLPKGGISVNMHTLLTRKDLIAFRIGENKLNGQSVTVVRIMSDKEESSLSSATLYIDEKNLLIHRAVISTKDNGTYAMDFTYGGYAAWGLPDKVVFSFNTREYKLPKGVTVDFGGKENQPAANDLPAKGTVEIVYKKYDINKGLDNRVFAD